jgi:hypothetical protein
MNNIILTSISILYLISVSAFSQKTQNKTLELEIFKVTDIELPPNENHYKIEKTIYCTLKNKDNQNYKFDSAWYFGYPNSYPRNPHYYIFDYGIKAVACQQDTCIIKSYFTPDISGYSNVGNPPKYEPNPYRTPYKGHQIKGPNKLKEKARLYYSYKGKWRMARFTGKIIYTPTEAERYKRDHAYDNEPPAE